NVLHCDVIVVTGDLVELEAYRDWLYDSLGMLTAKYGVYFILGNHDYFIDANRTVKDLEQRGLIYVGGRSVVTQWSGHPVLIAGNEAPWLKQLPHLQSFNDHAFRLLLLHSPDQLDWACAVGGNLALAGHT